MARRSMMKIPFRLNYLAELLAKNKKIKNAMIIMIVIFYAILITGLGLSLSGIILTNILFPIIFGVMLGLGTIFTITFIVCCVQGNKDKKDPFDYFDNKLKN